MIASLPMYDAPRVAWAWDALWSGVREGLRARSVPAPEALTRDIPDLMAHWLSPDLAISQTCGMPYRLFLHGKVTLVGTPDFGVEGCAPGHYRSVVVAREGAATGLGDLAGGVFAYNEPHSQSGWAALAAEAPEVLTGSKLRTGAHAASARAVAEGRADFAALDAVTWRFLCESGGGSGLTVIHTTRPTPGLPLICADGVDAEAVFEAVSDAVSAAAPDARATHGLRGLVRIPAADYLAVPTPPGP